MLKFIGNLKTSGMLYGFGLSESNLNRMEFNNEPIFFDFGYAGHPNIFGLVVYFGDLETPQDINSNIDLVKQSCIPFLDSNAGVTVESLRLFPIARNIMQQFRNVPFWGFNSQTEIAHPKDEQLFFAGRTEQDIEEYLTKNGLIKPQTKRTYKGFGKQN